MRHGGDLWSGRHARLLLERFELEYCWNLRLVEDKHVLEMAEIRFANFPLGFSPNRFGIWTHDFSILRHDLFHCAAPLGFYVSYIIQSTYVDLGFGSITQASYC